MNYSLLKNEILNGPKKDQLSIPWNKGNDTQIASILNAKDVRGLVPLEELSAVCLEMGLYGKCTVFERKPITDENEPLHELVAETLTLLRDDFRLTFADVDTERFQMGLNAYVNVLKWITQEQANQITALGANRRSRAIVLFGRDVTIEDIGNARRV